MKKKIDYKMLCDLIMVSVYEGETPEQALDRQMDVSVDRAVNEGVLKSGDDILDLELIKRGLV